MARRRISVDKIKEVIRYGVTTELSERAIGRALKVSCTAVTKYLECFRGSGLTWEQAQELPDSELLSVLEGNRMARTSARYERLAERFPMMVKELRRKGVTLQLLWEECLRAHPDGYQNSQFCHHFHVWRKSTEVSMHIDHKAGEKLFVDYAGDKLVIVNPDSGKEQPVETFVAILGASELTDVEASATQQGEDWIRSNERALRYCGGGTQVIVPDNLRSAVSRSDPYEPGINATFDAFAQEMPTMTNNQATLHKLDQMRLHGMARALRTSLDSQGQWTADELLAHLVDAEWDDRHERLLKAARFRYPAAIEEVDFALRRNLDQNQLLRLADCRWVGQHQDLIITGKCGSGKSFLASALGHQACLRGFRVGYHASSRLFGELRLAKADGSYVRELDKISKQALLIIDDFALEPLDALARLALLEILEDRHARASTLMVSQLPVSSWHEVIGEPTIADAIGDRIVHGAHRIDLEGDSIRKLYAERANRDPVT